MADLRERLKMIETGYLSPPMYKDTARDAIACIDELATIRIAIWVEAKKKAVETAKFWGAQPEVITAIEKMEPDE